MEKTLIFDRYAFFYDLIYQEKNYDAECDFIQEIIKCFSVASVESILDLGCGTGRHSLILAERGYGVTGIDLSERMIFQATERASGIEPLIKPDFHIGDIRNCDLNRTFDAVISMFAVFSYMVRNDDLMSALLTARRHLKAGGLLLFDAWFGPAVLHERPTDRYNIIGHDDKKIIRFSHPEIDILRHSVDVHYKVLCIGDDGIADEVNEIHTVRYLFPQEIAHYLECSGFILKKLCPFMDIDENPCEKDWSVAVIAEAV